MTSLSSSHVRSTVALSIKRMQNHFYQSLIQSRRYSSNYNKMIARLSLFVLIVVLSTAVAQKKARLTNYCSFPPCCKDKKLKPTYTAAEKKSCPGKAECTEFNGCAYQGDFSFCGDNKSHDYVINTNIVSFFSTHGDIDKYKKKTLRITKGSKSIEAIVCDTCSDKDCEGCCTENAGKSGYLIDMESNTYARFGVSDGDVTWTCVNC